MIKYLISLACLTTAATLAAGCGGGAASPTVGGLDSTTPATLKAFVVENDGQTTDLGGFRFTLVETGATSTSAPDGSLAFGEVPPGSVTLRLAETTSLLPLSVQTAGGMGHGGNDMGGGDMGHDGDGMGGGDMGRGEEHEPGDREHAHHGEVHVDSVEAREHVEIRIHMGAGEMTCVRVSRNLMDEREIEIQMERTDANDDPDMAGELELERDMHRQSFEVDVEGADADRELELFVADVDGNEESQGTRTVDALGEADWELDTSDGGTLPFAVSSLDELEDFTVEVRDATSGVVLLTATVAEMPPIAQDDEHGMGHDDDRSRGRALLTPVEAGLEGYVEIRSREDDGSVRERFKMEAEGLAVGREVEFLVEDPSAAGAFLSVGTRLAHGMRGKAHLELCTATGDTLPSGVTSVFDLVGLDVEIRDADSGDVLLAGTVPPLIAD